MRPAALWVATAFARLFGFNSFTVLAPQALMGIAAAGLLYLTVKRVAGPMAGLVAGATLALTPVAVLMFRFNTVVGRALGSVGVRVLAECSTMPSAPRSHGCCLRH
ncbi:glycosyltransferase family 39 protein [Kribbella sp. NPDC050124]|uniref:glycosyltransferase family 39 protein n=1 Tax=Kribbella sp. NPDC050124 TaxID=3364114 RepID=UPI003799D3CA